MTFKALLLDIEGTITSISFVKDVLFPYAYNNAEKYLDEHYDEPAIQILLEDFRRLAEQEAETDSNVVRIREPRQNCIEDVTKNVQYWIKKDKKLTTLKALQGLIWEEAYSRGDVKGHLYDDVVEILRQLHTNGVPIFIYSSGSVHAQKLLFANSTKGDVTPLLSGYFDTNVGKKVDKVSYARISETIGCAPGDILFLTDVEQEANAATDAGLQTKLVIRPGNAPLSDEALSKFETIHSIDQILDYDMLIRLLKCSPLLGRRSICTSRPSPNIFNKIKSFLQGAEKEAFDEECVKKAHKWDGMDFNEWTIIYRDPGASKTFAMTAIFFPCFLAGCALFAYDVANNKPDDRFEFVRRLENDAEELGALVWAPAISLIAVIALLLRVHKLRLLRIYQKRNDPEQFVAIKSKFVVGQAKHNFHRDLATGFYFADDQSDILRVGLNFVFGNIQVDKNRFMIMDDFFLANNYRTYMLNETNVPPRL
ncbi:unnamed protein product [Caenorhabditis bovis]|uniref:Enolase-phosphatase E1 n=1 Tax=Caenorhabditis bovis TaxID=2654633 RepID=A0A8S1E4R5_9PELO|nr:unnamed protein product [Caenorhabditis bovis]